MPYTRPKLTDLIKQAGQSIIASLPGSDALLRFSNLNVLSRVIAGFAHQHYGYLDYIALQATPYTATDEYLEAWGALRGVYRKFATQAEGMVIFPAVSGSVIPNGTPVVRSDSTQFTVISTEDGTGEIIATVQAVADPAGLTGAFGNTDAGTQFLLGQAVAGVTATGISGLITGGADLEDPDDFKNRVIAAYQSTPQGGAKQDYQDWALEVAGVSQAWCVPLVYGAGTVGVYFLIEPTSGNPSGLPQGTNGVATDEQRDTAATGDQLTLANYIYPLRPVTALVYALAPTLSPVDMSIEGVSTPYRAAVQAALKQAILNNTAPGKKVLVNDLWAAINTVDSVTDYRVLSPTSDIEIDSDAIATLGTITWS